MASSGAGADYVKTTQGIIFGPTLAYRLQLQAWGAEIIALLDKVCPKGAEKQPTTQNVAELAQVVTDAMQAGAVALAPVFKKYSGTDDLTTNVQQSTDDKIGVTAGVNISVINLSGTFGHDQQTTSSAQQNHHLSYEVEVPLPSVDTGERAAAAVRNWLLLRSLPATP